MRSLAVACFFLLGLTGAAGAQEGWDARFPLPGGQVPASTAPYPEPPFPLADFDAYILMQPTYLEFRGAWPEILLVTPDMAVTMEMRYDYSRFFPEADDQGRIVGGVFQ